MLTKERKLRLRIRFKFFVKVFDLYFFQKNQKNEEYIHI